MAGVSEQITLLVQAEVAKAISGLNKVNKTVDTTAKKQGDLQKQTELIQKSWLKMIGVVGGLAAAYKLVIQPAAELEEAQNKFSTLFRENIDSAEEWSDVLVNSYAMSRQEALDSLSAFQSMLKPLDMMPQAAAEMSNQFAKLAADLGSFNNVPTADVVRDLRSALAGSSETVEKYGANIKIAELQQFAMTEGIIKNKNELKGAAKAQAILAKIIRDTADAQGDMVRTGDSFANTMKRMNARGKTAVAIFGTQLLAPLKDLFNEFEQGAGDIEETAKKLGEMVGIAIRFGAVVINLAKIASTFSLTNVIEGLVTGKDQIAATGAEIDNLKNNFTKLKDDLTGFNAVLADPTATEQAKQNSTSLAEAQIANRQRVVQADQKAKDDMVKKQEEARAKFEELRRSDFENRMMKIQEEHAVIVEQKILNDEELLELDRITEERKWEVRVQLAEQNMQKITQLTSQFTSTLQQGFNLDQKLKERALDKEYNKRKAIIKATIKDEDKQKEELAKLEAEFEKKKSNLKRDAAKKEKAIAIANAVINTAAAVVSMLTAGFPVGIVMAALAGAMGAAQIALIAATPIPAAAEGGVIPGTTEGTLIRAGEALGTEAILPLENEAALEKLEPVLGGRGGNTVNIYVENLFATDDLPENLAIAIDQALLDLKQGGNSAFAESITEEQI